MDDPYEVVEATIDENGWSVVARGEHGMTFLVEGDLEVYMQLPVTRYRNTSGYVVFVSG